jgi:type III pantothenate kinase
MTDYVAERTALLPRVDLKGRHGAIGRSTVGAMRLGAHLGYRGMVRELTTHLLNQDGLRNAALCATGGYAGWVLRGSGLDYALDANLTLYGLGRIYALNTEGEQ